MSLQDYRLGTVLERVKSEAYFAGIVWASEPEREWEECLVKARVATGTPSHLPFT